MCGKNEPCVNPVPSCPFWAGTFEHLPAVLSKRLHEEIHGMEDVEFHCECCNLIFCRLCQSVGFTPKIEHENQCVVGGWELMFLMFTLFTAKMC